MCQFHPDNLSPVSVEPRECNLPYGLTWQELRPCLPNLDNRRVDDLRAFESYEKQGLHKGSNSRILTLRYVTRDGRSREMTMFVKQTADARSAEAARYRFAASCGVPTPRLLLTVPRHEGEVIVLEFLPRIGIDFRSLAEVRELLQLVARLNAIETAADIFEPDPGTPQVEFDAQVKVALTTLSHTPSPIVDAERWFHAYQSVRDAPAALPVALTHGEFSVQQTGWSERDGTRSPRLVMFDLATMAHRPRFFDIAGILPLLTRETGQSESELLTIYLDSLRRFTGKQLAGEDVMREIRLVRACDAFNSLPWLTQAVTDPDGVDLRHVLALTTRTLHNDLASLGFLH